MPEIIYSTHHLCTNFQIDSVRRKFGNKKGLATQNIATNSNTNIFMWLLKVYSLTKYAGNIIKTQNV